MAYKIQYGVNNSGQFKRTTSKKSSSKRLIIVLLLLTLLLTALFTDAHRMLIDILIPGDNAVTIRAVNIFAEEMKAGESFYDAIASFCSEVLFSAKG